MVYSMRRFEPYLLDRITDDFPGNVLGNSTQTFSLDQLKASVARDLEALLNTRCALTAGVVNDLPLAKKSVLRYGIDDFSSRSLASVADREFICIAIRSAIADQEPRLRNVDVGLESDTESGPGYRLRFNIKALLHIHLAAEPVVFDAVLQTGSQRYLVSPSSRLLSAVR